MILHALALTAEAIGIGLVLSVAFGALIYGIGKLEERAERRYLAAIEREEARVAAERHAFERRRSEMRSFNARPTANERWRGLV